VNVALPDGVRTGLVPLDVRWLGQPICDTAWVRIIPAGPSVPRIVAISDGVNLLLDHRTNTGSIKVTMIEVTRPEEFQAQIDGGDVRDIDAFCADPLTSRYEFNFRLPDGTPPGPHHLTVTHGKRSYPPTRIEVL
jgi:hypothetical protein